MRRLCITVALTPRIADKTIEWLATQSCSVAAALVPAGAVWIDATLRAWKISRRLA